MEVLAGGLFLS